MSKSIVLFVAVAISVLFATPALSSPDSKSQVRVKYGENNKAPDHLAYAFLLRYMAIKKNSEEDFAVSIVRENMKFESVESAREFLEQLLVEGGRLADENRKAKANLLCKNHATRSDAGLYTDMDSLDDTRAEFARHAYIQFRQSLSGEDRKNFKSWIDDVKEGYSYTAFNHASLFENRGIDVNIHVQQLCIKNAQEELEGDSNED